MDIKIKSKEGIDDIWQWDTGRKLEIISESIIDEIHFSTKKMCNAIVVKPYQDSGRLIADVPNRLLQQSFEITVYLVRITDGDKQTVYSTRLNIHPRKKPDDYIYTESEILRWEVLENDIEKCKKVINELHDELNQLSWNDINENPFGKVKKHILMRGILYPANSLADDGNGYLDPDSEYVFSGGVHTNDIDAWPIENQSLTVVIDGQNYQSNVKTYFDAFDGRYKYVSTFIKDDKELYNVYFAINQDEYVFEMNIYIDSKLIYGDEKKNSLNIEIYFESMDRIPTYLLPYINGNEVAY